MVSEGLTVRRVALVACMPVRDGERGREGKTESGRPLLLQSHVRCQTVSACQLYAPVALSQSESSVPGLQSMPLLFLPPENSPPSGPGGPSGP